MNPSGRFTRVPNLGILYLERENRLHYNPWNDHKSACGPHGRDVTHILSRASCFLLKSFHFHRLQKPQVFSIQILIFPLYFEYYATMPMLIFRAWTTCEWLIGLSTDLLTVWMVDLLMDRPFDWLTDWLTVCMVYMYWGQIIWWINWLAYWPSLFSKKEIME